MVTRFADIALDALISFAPLVMALIVAALVSPFFLGSWNVSSKALVPDLKRLDPLKGLTRIVSWSGLLELVKGVAKSSLIGGVAVAVLWSERGDLLALFGQTVEVPSLPFPRIPLAEAREIVKGRGYDIPRTDGDLDPEGERQISAHVQETYGHQFVFITDYHPEIRPFYHMRDAETGLTCSYDLLFRGTEITTGAQREHRIDVLEAQAVEKGLSLEGLEHYLDFFRYGIPPHGGFGMGLARVLMLMLGQDSIREVTYLFRGPTRLAP